MADLFILAFLGHLVGDFILQNKYMALHKQDRGWPGTLACTVHVTLYTGAVCLFWWTIDPLIIALIFVPHWIIDRWSLANYWLKLIRSRTFEAVSEPKDIAFTSLVYVMADMTMHFISLWLVIIFVML